MRTYYTHRLTQRSLSVWLEVGTKWLPKQGLYYRDPRISDTRRPVLPPGRAESGRWPVAQIAIISSITCSTDSHLWTLIVEHGYTAGIKDAVKFRKSTNSMQSHMLYLHLLQTHTLHTQEHIRSCTPHVSWMGRDFLGIMCLGTRHLFYLLPLWEERLRIYSALFKGKISCLLTSTL